jgi:MFS family permease
VIDHFLEIDNSYPPLFADLKSRKFPFPAPLKDGPFGYAEEFGKLRGIVYGILAAFHHSYYTPGFIQYGIIVRTVETELKPKKKGIYLIIVSRITRSIAAGMINIAFPYYILVDLHQTAGMIGLIYVAATIATAVLSFLAGITTDVWGKRGTLFIASALLPVSSALVYFSSSLWVVFIAAMVGGYSATGSLVGGGIGGAVQPIQNTIITELTPSEKRTKYFSFLTFLSGFTAALGALLAKVFTVQEIFLVATVIAAAGVIALPFIEVREAKGKLRVLKTKATIGKFTLTGILNGFSQGLIVPFLIPFFLLIYNIPKSQMAEYAFISGIVGSVALLAAPFLEKYLGFVKSMVWTRGIGTILFVAFPIIRFLPFAIFVYVVGPALRIMALPIQQAELTRRVDGDEMGRALGVNQVARLAASSAGTGLAGYLMDAALFEIPFFAYGVVMIANSYLYVRFFGKKRKEIDK